MLDPNVDKREQAEEHRNAATLFRHRSEQLNQELYEYFEGAEILELITPEQFQRVGRAIEASRREVARSTELIRQSA